ncbi:Chromatin structure remodeling complex protein sfh1 [Coemansia sp. Benny D115]|nr:Chromatin structure remodeling complex protein sfh1 [Coemansia sp. Benny D115]
MRFQDPTQLSQPQSQYMGVDVFKSSYLERLKEGDTAMLVLSTLGNSGNGAGALDGISTRGGMAGSSVVGSSGMGLRSRSTRGSRRNLREWSSGSENEYGAEEEVDSPFETEVSSAKQGSEAGDERAARQDLMSGIGPQPAYESLPKRARRRTAHFHMRDDQAAWLSQQPEALVPIRLEMEVGDYRLHDVFVWNAREQLLTPEHFATIYCTDLSLPTDARSGAVEYVAQLIRQQVAEHVSAADCEFAGEELRVNLNIEVQVGPHVLRDRIEWDILEPLGSRPEEYARCLCRELGLGGEYPPLVAHRVREEVARLHRELSEAGDAQWLRQAPVDSIFRPINLADAWGPSIEIMSAEDLDRMWVLKERTYRRTRRSERAHTRTFNFLPPEIVSVEPPVSSGLAAASMPIINPAFYTQASVDNIDAVSSGATTPKTARRSNSGARLPGTSSSRPSTPRSYSKTDLSSWECEHCGCNSSITPIQRQGPNGPKTLCNACGIAWMVRNRQELPSHRKDLYRK